MENEEAKRLGVLGAVSKCAGAGIGTVVAAGGKVTGTVKNLLIRPVDEFALVTDEQDEATPPTPAIEPEEDELVSKITALESDLAEIRGQLAETQKQVDHMQSQFDSQLSKLQAKKDSLVFDLEQKTKEIKGLISIEATLRARITALESELDTAKAELEKAHRPDIFVKP